MPAPTFIRAVSIQGPSFNPLGVYEHSIRWDTDGRNGFIVQHIKRHEVYECPGMPNSNARTADDYWEAWRVDGLGGVFPRVVAGWNDKFSTSAFRPGAHAPRQQMSKGHWRIEGSVYWIAQDRFREANWTKDARGGANAGILYTRTTRPHSVTHCYLRRNESGEWDAIANPPIAHRRRV